MFVESFHETGSTSNTHGRAVVQLRDRVNAHLLTLAAAGVADDDITVSWCQSSTEYTTYYTAHITYRSSEYIPIA